MERSNTPPPARRTRSQVTSPPTPDVKRRIEENRLKAKALREQSIAREKASSINDTNRTPSGSLLLPDITLAGQKRTHSSISTSSVPATSRDARQTTKDARADDSSLQAARKFRKYVDHDFSKMTDTKGGFLAVEDDPWNKALHASKEERNLRT